MARPLKLVLACLVCLGVITITVLVARRLLTR
jgi:hypothetical protein